MRIRLAIPTRPCVECHHLLWPAKSRILDIFRLGKNFHAFMFTKYHFAVPCLCSTLQKSTLTFAGYNFFAGWLGGLRAIRAPFLRRTLIYHLNGVKNSIYAFNTWYTFNTTKKKLNIKKSQRLRLHLLDQAKHYHLANLKKGVVCILYDVKAVGIPCRATSFCYPCKTQFHKIMGHTIFWINVGLKLCG